MSKLFSFKPGWIASIIALAATSICWEAHTINGPGIKRTLTTRFPANPESKQAVLISNAVMSKDVKGDYLEPVGITDSFAANQSEFHAVITLADAPTNTSVKAIWLTSSDEEMGTAELTSSGTRNLDFSFTPDAGKLPAGEYKVEIYVNNRMNRTLTFTVLANGSAPSTMKSSSTEPAKASGYVKEIVMAKNTEGPLKKPVNPTEEFSPEDILHAVVGIQNAPDNTTFEIGWFAEDVGDAASKDSLINSDSATTEGTRNIDFTIESSQPWPEGQYRVEVYVNGALDSTKTFSIKK